MDPLASNFDPLATAHATNSPCSYDVHGCTDSSAVNYVPHATVDDGSCEAVVEGCTQPTALDFNSLANALTTCTYPLRGCTHSAAFNYQPLANVDDGSCIEAIYGCMVSTAHNFNSAATVDDGTCAHAVLGCTSASALNYASAATVDDGSCIAFVPGCSSSRALNRNPTVTHYAKGSCIFRTEGCTDSSAYNYLVSANVDDGSCIAFPARRQLSSLASETPHARRSLTTAGCTVPSATNHNSAATLDDGSCIFDVVGCTDSEADNFLADATLDSGACEHPGCTDSVATNFDPSATLLDDSCSYDFGGCTNSAAENYLTSATTDNGGCIYRGCTDSTAFNYDETATDNDGTCVALVNGCSDAKAANFHPFANAPTDSACIYYGCTDTTALNFDASANHDDGTCSFDIAGCTESSAENYLAAATVDDGGCRYPGCTDSTARSFDATASFDDGSCAYYSPPPSPLPPPSEPPSPPPSLPPSPPPPPLLSATMRFTLDTTIAAFNESIQSAFIAGLADLVNANATQLAFESVTAASVVAVVTLSRTADEFGVTSEEAAREQVAAALGNITAAELSDALGGISVLSLEVLTRGCADQAASNYDSAAQFSTGCVYLPMPPPSPPPSQGAATGGTPLRPTQNTDEYVLGQEVVDATWFDQILNGANATWVEWFWLFVTLFGGCLLLSLVGCWQYRRALIAAVALEATRAQPVAQAAPSSESSAKRNATAKPEAIDDGTSEAGSGGGAGAGVGPGEADGGGTPPASPEAIQPTLQESEPSTPPWTEDAVDESVEPPALDRHRAEPEATPQRSSRLQWVESEGSQRCGGLPTEPAWPLPHPFPLTPLCARVRKEIDEAFPAAEPRSEALRRARAVKSRLNSLPAKHRVRNCSAAPEPVAGAPLTLPSRHLRSRQHASSHQIPRSTALPLTSPANFEVRRVPVCGNRSTLIPPPAAAAAAWSTLNRARLMLEGRRSSWLPSARRAGRSSGCRPSRWVGIPGRDHQGKGAHRHTPASGWRSSVSRSGQKRPDGRPRARR